MESMPGKETITTDTNSHISVVRKPCPRASSVLISIILSLCDKGVPGHKLLLSLKTIVHVFYKSSGLE